MILRVIKTFFLKIFLSSAVTHVLSGAAIPILISMYSSHHPILQYELTHPSSLCSPFLLYHSVPCHSIPRAISPLACPKQISNRSQTLPHPLCLAPTRLAFQSLLFPCHVGPGIEYDCDCFGWKGKSEYWGRWLEGTARDGVWSVSSS